MKCTKLIAAGLIAGAAVMAAAEVNAAPGRSHKRQMRSKNMVTRVDPPNWWVGMKNDTLQLMLNGKDIAASTFSTDYPGVKIIEQVTPDSPNYKFL